MELSEDQNLENCQQCITLLIFLEKQLNIVFEQNLGTRVNAVRNQSVGNLVIYNLKEEDVGIDPDLKKFFGVGEKHGTGTYIKRLNSPASYFTHCDGENGKSPRRKTFQTSGEVFDTGSAHERVDYAALYIMCYVT